MKKTSIEAALAFSTKQTLFSFEDTQEKCYQDFIDVLEHIQWKRIPYRKKSKVEKKKLPPRGEVPRFIATLNEGDIDYSELTPDQWVNHFEGISQLTTKQGLCDLTRSVSAFQVAADEVLPRGYNLGDACQRDEFIDDFRWTAACIVLRYYLYQRLYVIVPDFGHNNSTSSSAATSSGSHGASNSGGKVGSRGSGTNPNASATSSNPRQALPCLVECNSNVFQWAMYAMQWQVRVKLYGEWPEVDISKHFKDKEIPLTDKEWYEICCKSYECARVHHADVEDFHVLSSLLGCGGPAGGLSAAAKMQLFQHFQPVDYKVTALLKAYQSIHPQFFMDGMHNIWIMKSPDSSCGIGMRISHRLEEMLEIERGMGGRIVQKYTEIPLLAPMSRQVTMQVWKQMYKAGASMVHVPSVQWAKCKFDLRVWVVITSLSPKLQAYIYPVVYGRRCSTTYHNDVQSLGEHYVHLTNYSLQKKATASNNSSSAATEDNNNNNNSSSSSKKTKLRKLCKDARLPQPPPNAFDGHGPDGTNSAANGNKKEEELLIRFDELQQIFQLHFLEQKATHRLSAELSASVRSGDVEEVWRDFLFPKIKSQVLAVLHTFSVHDAVKARPNSYEFLGVDVLVDQCLDARILEVNMSPAMAHRTPEQSAVIRLMAQQFMAQHVIPKLPETHFKEMFQEWVDQEESAFGEALPWQNWQPLHAAGDANIDCCAFEAVEPVPEMEVKNVPVDDWDVVDPAAARPPLVRSSSAASARPKSASAAGSFRRRSFVLQSDDAALPAVPLPPPVSNTGGNLLSYVLVGKAVTPQSIVYIDFLCQQFQLISRLQRWWRLKLRHCRFHRERRTHACITVQCAIRMYLSKRRKMQLVHALFSNKIRRRQQRSRLQQCIQHWIYRRHAAVLSFHFKKYLLKKRHLEKLRRLAAMTLQRFVRRVHRKILWCNYQRLVFTVYRYKKWLRRQVCVVTCVTKLWLRRRVKHAKRLQRAVRQFLVQAKLRKAYLKLKLKQLASEAKRRLSQVLVLKKERQCMAAEEADSAALRWLPRFAAPVPPQPPVLADELGDDDDDDVVVVVGVVEEDATMEQFQEAGIPQNVLMRSASSTALLQAESKESIMMHTATSTVFSEEKRTAKKLPRSQQDTNTTSTPTSSTCSLAEDKADVQLKPAPEIISFEEFLARPLDDHRGIPLPKERPGKHLRPAHTSDSNPLACSWDEEAIQQSSMLHASRFVKSGVAATADSVEAPLPPPQQSSTATSLQGSQRMSRPYLPTATTGGYPDHNYTLESPRTSQASTSVLHFPYDPNNSQHRQEEHRVYSAQSLHEVLRERQTLFNLRQQQQLYQQLHVQSNVGMDNFFSNTLAQPSPSPVFSPFQQPEGFHPMASKAPKAPAGGMLNSKSRPGSASSTSASKLKHTSSISTTTQSSQQNTTTLNTQAIYHSGNGTIASPRSSKKARPQSAGATKSSKKEKESEKKKKERISALYLYK